jgi:hypothetical protein
MLFLLVYMSSKKSGAINRQLEALRRASTSSLRTLWCAVPDRDTRWASYRSWLSGVGNLLYLSLCSITHRAMKTYGGVRV